MAIKIKSDRKDTNDGINYCDKGMEETEDKICPSCGGKTVDSAARDDAIYEAIKDTGRS